MESTNTAKTETEVKAKVEPTGAIIAAITPPPTSTIKKVAFWGGIGVAAFAIGAGIAYWMNHRDSSVSETAENTAEALRR